MRKAAARVIAIGKAVAGWFGLYVAAGGVLAYIIVPGPYTDAPGCYPFHDDFAQIETNCSSAAGDLLWAFLLGIPRLAITPMYLAIDLIWASAKNSWDMFYLSRSVPYLISSIPPCALYFVAFSYWKRHRAWVALLFALLMSMEVLALGFAG